MLTALVDDHGEVVAKSPAERAAISTLNARVRSWAAPLRSRSVLADLVARVRIVPPTELDVTEAHQWAGLEAEELPWLAGIELSPAGDQSLVVEAPDLWSDRHASARLGLSAGTR